MFPSNVTVTDDHKHLTVNMQLTLCHFIGGLIRSWSLATILCMDLSDPSSVTCFRLGVFTRQFQSQFPHRDVNQTEVRTVRWHFVFLINSGLYRSLGEMAMFNIEWQIIFSVVFSVNLWKEY